MRQGVRQPSGWQPPPSNRYRRCFALRPTLHATPRSRPRHRLPYRPPHETVPGGILTALSPAYALTGRPLLAGVRDYGDVGAACFRGRERDLEIVDGPA